MGAIDVSSPPPPPPTTCSCPYTLLTQVMASPRMHRSGRPSDAYVVRQHRGRGRHRRRLLIGGEFNHQIPPDIEGITGPWAQGPQRRRRAARKRFVETAKTDSIVQFATSAGVTIWNTFPGNYAGATPGPITAWRSPDGCTTTQIDYFVGDSEICRAWGVAEPAGRSDRSVVWTQIAPPVQRNKPKVAKPVTLKEWESAEAIAMTMFRTTLCGMTQDLDLGTTRNTTTGAAAELTMRERAITQAAGGDATATTNCDRGQAEVPTRLVGHGEGSEPMQPHRRQENGATEGVPATSPRLAGRSGSMGNHARPTPCSDGDHDEWHITMVDRCTTTLFGEVLRRFCGTLGVGEGPQRSSKVRGERGPESRLAVGRHIGRPSGFCEPAKAPGTVQHRPRSCRRFLSSPLEG